MEVSRQLKQQRPALTARFTPSAIHLSGGIEELTVAVLTIDGSSEEVRLQPAADGLRLALPPRVQDGRPHEIGLDIEAAGQKLRFESEVAADYVGFIERIDDELVGWIYDRAEPDRLLTLELELDGRPMGSLRADIERADLVAAGHPARHVGFRRTLPATPGLLAPRRVVLRIAGTGCDPFGMHLGKAELPAYAAALMAVEPGPRDALRDSVLRPALLRALRAGGGLELPFGVARNGNGAPLRDGPPVIDVVVPVYRGIDETLDCIASVLGSGGAIPFRLVVVDDCGPEPALSEAIAALADEGRLILLRNDRNLGFVASVNRGMALSAEHDVVLLNSDTVVAPGWLDRLYAAAYSDERIATATALSNNASICSLPAIGGMSGLPYGADLAAVDAACAQANAGRVVDLPTAHGFCMFIKRAAIADLGLFDAATFGRGYGEENDFSLRAASRGWRNVAACDVFVQHLGSVSFGEAGPGLTEGNLRLLAERYPDYHTQVMDFIRRDPMAAARAAAQKHFWRGRRMVVLVSLAIGGGVARHVADVTAALAAEGILPLLLTRGEAGAFQAYQLAAGMDGRDGTLLYPDSPTALAEAMADIIDLAPACLHVHSLLDLEAAAADAIRLSGIPYRVTLHDFFYLCPRVTLLDEAARFCHLPAPAACDRCISRGGAHPALEPSHLPRAGDVGAWREYWARFLRGAASVHAPSQSAATLHSLFLGAVRIDVLPHETVQEEPVPAPEAERQDNGAIRVAVIGAIGPHKGLGALLDLLRYAERWAPDLAFVLVGHAADDRGLAGFSNLSVTGAYAPQEAAAAIAAARCGLALFLSPWPETYAYTLSEAMSAGLTPVAPRIGAFTERLDALSHGHLFDPEASAQDVVRALRAAAELPSRRFAFAPAAPPAMPSGPETLPLLRAVCLPQGCFHDLWLSRDAGWRFYASVPVQRIEIALYVPEGMPGQHVTLALGGRRLVRKPLKPGIVVRVGVNADDARGLLVLDLAFDYDIPMSPPDIRRGAAVLNGLRAFTPTASLTWQPDGQWQVDSPGR